MDSKVVDIFIPTISNHMPYIKRSFGSLYFQEYAPIRVVLWIEDPGTAPIEHFLKTMWYEPHEQKESPLTSDTPVQIEYCSNGVLVRNYMGRTGNAWRARQWIFEWEGKSDFVKMLDSDDIMMPWAINTMMSYMADDITAVFHPLMNISSYRFAVEGPNRSISGAAQMLIRKSTMKRILNDGFRWDKDNDDREFYAFFRKHGYKYVMTDQSAMYLYIK